MEAHKADLVDWGATDDDIAEARAAIKAYEDSLAKRNSTKAGHEGERQSIESMFATGDRLLNRQIDKMVKKLKKKNPQFFSDYEAAREIRDVAATRKGDGSTPAQPGGEGTEPSSK